MDDKKQEMMAMLKKLADDFHAQIPERMEKIISAWNEVNDNFDNEKQAEFLRLTHSLAGTSSTFGFTEISGAAKKLELSLKDIDCAESLQNNHKLISDNIEKLNQITQEA